MRILFRLLFLISFCGLVILFLGFFGEKSLNRLISYITQKSRYTSVTIIEGWNRQEIARALKEKGVFLDEKDFLNKTADLEGYLFPDTYLFLRGSTPQEVIETLTKNFQKKTKDLNPSKEEIILASILEREAKNFEEKRIIAGIYLKRKAMGIPLQADPTVQYAKYVDLGLAPIIDGKANYWAPITQSDYYSVKSEYNTYLHKGWPKGPICNPGLESIKAAISPKETDYLYFFHRDGQIYFSKTLEEHQEKQKLYSK